MIGCILTGIWYSSWRHTKVYCVNKHCRNVCYNRWCQIYSGFWEGNWYVWLFRNKQKCCLYIFNKNLLFMLRHTWVKYKINVVLCCLFYILYYFYPTIDIKKNSEDIWPNSPKFHFQYRQLSTTTMLNHLWHTNKMIQIKDMPLWNLSFHKD